MTSLVSTASDLQDVVRNSIVSFAHNCGGKGNCSNPKCIYQKVQRHKDPINNPYLDLCYTSTIALWRLIKHVSGSENVNRVKVYQKDGPTGRRHAKGIVQHFWLEVDGEVFDPSYPQYVIGKTALPTYEGGKYRPVHKEPLRKPERVIPLIKKARLAIT